MPETVKNLRDALNQYVGLLVSFAIVVGVPVTGWIVLTLVEHGEDLATLKNETTHVRDFVKVHNGVTTNTTNRVSHVEARCSENDARLNSAEKNISRLYNITSFPIFIPGGDPTVDNR